MESKGAGERAQWLRAPTAPVEDASSVPSTHARWLTTPNSSFRRSDDLFWPPHVHKTTYIYTHLKIKIFKNYGKKIIIIHLVTSSAHISAFRFIPITTTTTFHLLKLKSYILTRVSPISLPQTLVITIRSPISMDFTTLTIHMSAMRTHVPL